MRVRTPLMEVPPAGWLMINVALRVLPPTESFKIPVQVPATVSMGRLETSVPVTPRLQAVSERTRIETVIICTDCFIFPLLPTKVDASIEYDLCEGLNVRVHGTGTRQW